MPAEELDELALRWTTPLGKDAKLPPTQPLADRGNWDRYQMMEAWKDYPGVAIFAEPVELWPKGRAEDFLRIRLAIMRAGEPRQEAHRLSVAWEAALAWDAKMAAGFLKGAPR